MYVCKIRYNFILNFLKVCTMALDAEHYEEIAELMKDIDKRQSDRDRLQMNINNKQADVDSINFSLFAAKMEYSNNEEIISQKTKQIDELVKNKNQ